MKGLLRMTALLLPVAVGAAEPVPTLDGSTALLQLVVNLGLVLGLILLAAWLFRKLNRVQARAAGGDWMQVRATLPLGLREKLVLVQVGQRYLVLGINQQRMECLATLDEIRPPGESDFADLMRAQKEEKG